MNKLVALLFLTFSIGHASPAPSQPANYQALYVFGDSFEATTGGPFWNGRYSNGPMWPELLSTNLGFAYRPGNNRAAGGATTAGVLSQVRSLPTPTNAQRALFVVDVGHAEFVPYLSATNATAWTNTTRGALLNISNSVVECYRKGARTVALMGIWDPNHSPRLARIIINPEGSRQRSKIFNANLAALSRSLKETFPQLAVIQVDFFPFFDALVTKSDYYGFTRTDLGAAEDPNLTDKSYTGPGKDYMFWDGSHLTAKGHALVAKTFLAALRGVTLDIRRQEQGYRILLDSMQIGKTYCVEQSQDLVRWEPLTPFLTLEPTGQHLADPGSPCAFFRVCCAPDAS